MTYRIRAHHGMCFSFFSGERLQRRIYGKYGEDEGETGTEPGGFVTLRDG